MKKIFYFLIIIFSFLSCNEEDNLLPNNNDVSIKTVSHTINSDGGVTLTGQINNVEIPIAYGFIISREETGTFFENARETKIRTGVTNGEFSIDFKSNLGRGIRYSYGAFAIKNGKNIYGKEKVFISNGSATPIISSIVPEKAHLGDTINIKGLYFSNNPTIKINERIIYPIIGNDTLIKCIVSNRFDNFEDDELPTLNIEITSATSNYLSYDDKLLLHTPRIDSIVPYEVSRSDTITIYGDHFSESNFGNRIYIDGSLYTQNSLLSSSRKEIKLIKRVFKSFEPVIKINSQAQNVTFYNKIKRKLPKIKGYSKNKLKFGDKLVVYGEDFPIKEYYSSDDLKFEIDNKRILYLETYRDSLVIDIRKSGFNFDFNMEELRISLFENEVSFREELTIDENILRVLFQQSFFNSGIINGQSYSMHYSDPVARKFNTDSNHFEVVKNNAIDRQISSTNNIAFGNSSIYFLNQIDNKIHKYNVTDHTVELITLFPEDLKGNGIVFEVINDNLFVGLGRSYEEEIAYGSLWSYSLNEDKWTKRKENLEKTTKFSSKYNTIRFVFNDKIFFGGVLGNDLWEYNTVTNEYVRKNDLPIDFPYKSIRIKPYVIGNKAYIGYGGNTYIYNTTNDTWSSKKDLEDIEDGYNIYFFHDDQFLYSSIGNYILKSKRSYFE